MGAVPPYISTMISVQQSAHSSKAGLGVYGLAVEDDRSTSGENLGVKTCVTSVYQGGATEQVTELRENSANYLRSSPGCVEVEVTGAFHCQSGDLDGVTESKVQESVDMKSTAFVDDGETMYRAFPSNKPTDDITVKDMSVVDFMAKPLLAADFTWNTTQTVDTIIYAVSVDTLLQGNAYWANKIQGFAMYRGTACFKLMINPSPFQAGKLLVHWLPNVDFRSSVDPSFVAMHNLNICTKLQQPHVEIDCRDTAAEIHIPYVSPTEFVKGKSASEKIDWGTIYISVLSPLAVGSSSPTTVDCGLYLWFEDFQLAGPCIPQAGGQKGKIKKFKVSTMSREAVGVSTKPISTALEYGAKAADSLSSVPVLSAFASTASWALRAASGVAGIFGWSKPMLETPPTAVTKQFNRYGAVADGADCSYPLGILPDNRVETTDVISIRDEDEMSFAFLKKVATVTDRATWLGSASSGTTLLSKTMYPLNNYVAGTTTYSTHTANWRVGPPSFYLANWFAYWRGSFKVLLKIVKTDFHSGRLQITWTPKGYGAVATPNLYNSLIAQRWIVDIRETNMIEIELPWFIAGNYLPVSQGSGVFDVIVLNELRYPETVSSGVELLFYVSGGDDFELAGPGCSNTTNVPYPFSPQAGDQLIKSGAIDQSATKPHTLEPSTLSMGEIFTSVKQLLSRQGVLKLTTWNFDLGVVVWPWTASVLSMNSTTGALQLPLLGGDAYCVLAPMYAMYRGSMKITLRTSEVDLPSAGYTTGRNNSVVGVVNPTYVVEKPNTVDIIGPWSNLPSRYYSEAAITSYTDYVTCNAGVAVSDSGNGVHAFSVPYYCPTKGSLTLQNTSGTKIPSLYSTPTAVLEMTGRGSTTTSSGCGFYRSAGDDFQFSYFLGAPPVIYSYT